MAIGLGWLGLSPAAFWAMTPREMAAVLHGFRGSHAEWIDRGALGRLMRQFPDA